MSDTRINELIKAVEAFLEGSVLPDMEGFKAYNTKVAINMLKIVQREISLRSELEQIDTEAASVFDIAEIGDDIVRNLSLAIRDGNIEINEELLAYLRKRTLMKLEIDNPKYSGYRQALATNNENNS